MHPFATLQRLLPQHGLSRLTGAFARSRQPLVKRALIETFKSAYRVDMSEFDGDGAADYASFNDFFTRRLLPGARPLPADAEALACPADGTISQAGQIRDGRLLQAKGRRYAVADLLGGDEDFAANLDGGCFATIYLAPHNYHRVHAPCDARLVQSAAVPGRLFSVNAVTERHVGNLFARNERLLMRFEARFGSFALAMVGAMIVASIDANWSGAPSSPYRGVVKRQPEDVAFRRGDELGAFLLGSTVVMLLPPAAVELNPALGPGTRVQMGAVIGRIW